MAIQARPRFVPYYAPRPSFIAQVSALTFVYFADSAATAADAALGAAYGSDVPAGSESAWWQATVFFADLASGSDGAMLVPLDGDYGIDAIGGLGGGGGSGPSGSLWNKTYEFLIIPLAGDQGAPVEGALGGAGASDLGGLSDGGLGADLGGDSGLAAEYQMESIANGEVYSADVAAALEAYLLGQLGGEGPAGAEGFLGAFADAELGSGACFALASDLGGDSGTGQESSVTSIVSAALVPSADSGVGAEAAILDQLGADSGQGADPGGGGFNSVAFATALTSADSAVAGASAFEHLVGADSGLGGETDTTALVTFGYHVYGNSGSGPIDYSTILVTILGFTTTTWTSSALSYAGDWKFGVRAFNANGEEQNLDVSVEIILDASGNDITKRPLPPIGLRALPMAAAAIRVEWTYAAMNPAKLPTGFHVYIGTGGSPSYGSPVATVSYQSAIANMFVANLAGLTGGTTYSVGVRAYNATAEEPNTTSVNVTADATGPASVVSLTASAVAG